MSIRRHGIGGRCPPTREGSMGRGRRLLCRCSSRRSSALRAPHGPGGFRWAGRGRSRCRSCSRWQQVWGGPGGARLGPERQSAPATPGDEGCRSVRTGAARGSRLWRTRSEHGAMWQAGVAGFFCGRPVSGSCRGLPTECSALALSRRGAVLSSHAVARAAQAGRWAAMGRAGRGKR